MTKSELARNYFLKGANCAQAVLCAFAPECGLDEEQAMRIASGFGGGMGRMREVCGAVSGMILVADHLCGYTSFTDKEAKDAHYALIQQLAGSFRQENGSIICRELLDNPPSDPNPSPRTAQYYAERPCARFVMLAAKILDDYIASHPVENRS